jgi:hypothetical protein
MKYRVLCFECQQINSEIEACFIDVLLRDDGVYLTTCPQGHEINMVLHNEHFEILLNFGMNAFLEGYFREAVVNMASSLERFYEFYIELTTLKSGVEPAAFDQSWKPISNQSERQLGAFIFLYTLNNKKTPNLLPSAQINFRNEVIHKGRIPEETKVLEFCDEVFMLLRSYIWELHDKEPEAVQTVRKRHIYQKHERAKFQSTSVSVAPTIFNLANTGEPHSRHDSFLSALVEFRRWKESIYL